METLLIFFLNCSFFDIVVKNQKLVFKIRDFLPFLYINLKLRAKFQIYRLHIRDSDWFNFIHFLRYKYKIKLVSVLRKRDDQALISISTILKYSAKVIYFFWSKLFRLHWVLDECTERKLSVPWKSWNTATTDFFLSLSTR